MRQQSVRWWRRRLLVQRLQRSPPQKGSEGSHCVVQQSPKGKLTCVAAIPSANRVLHVCGYRLYSTVGRCVCRRGALLAHIIILSGGNLATLPEVPQ